ncbi:MAG TPA: hypothetical protein VM528_10350, partial [Burkholderiaceae bacterium]|nr:hypothetical protein [Burkholderiaceae bacterium]
MRLGQTGTFEQGGAPAPDAPGAQRRPFVAALEEFGAADIGRVGGKNASLGEMMQRLRGAGVV